MSPLISLELFGSALLRFSHNLFWFLIMRGLVLSAEIIKYFSLVNDSGDSKPDFESKMFFSLPNFLPIKQRDKIACIYQILPKLYCFMGKGKKL